MFVRRKVPTDFGRFGRLIIFFSCFVRPPPNSAKQTLSQYVTVEQKTDSKKKKRKEIDFRGRK
jgi:hypothetical protein